MFHRPIIKPNERRRPMVCKFYDQVANVGFTATIPFVKNGINKATSLLQETGFVALEELYSFWGIEDFVNLVTPGPDISYMDLREVLGWDLLQGIRILDIELKPEIRNNQVIINIVYNDWPEFWDVRSRLNPYDSELMSEEYLDCAHNFGRTLYDENGNPYYVTDGYSGFGLSEEQQIKLYERRKLEV